MMLLLSPVHTTRVHGPCGSVDRAIELGGLYMCIYITFKMTYGKCAYYVQYYAPHS